MTSLHGEITIFGPSPLITGPRLQLGVISQYTIFGPPSPPSYQICIHGSHLYHIDIIGHVAAALGPLACASRSARPRHVAAALGPIAYPSRSARPRKCLNLT